MCRPMIIATCLAINITTFTMEQTKVNRFQCHSVNHYKTTLQDQIAKKDWQSVLQTERNMFAFLEDDSVKRTHAFGQQEVHQVKSVVASAITLATILIRPHVTRLLIAGPVGFLALYNAVKGITLTPDNIFNSEKKWLAKTTLKVVHELNEFRRQQNAAKVETLVEKHA